MTKPKARPKAESIDTNSNALKRFKYTVHKSYHVVEWIFPSLVVGKKIVSDIDYILIESRQISILF